MTPHVNCALVERWISLALDGELPAEAASELELHLDGCAACRERQQHAVQQQQLLDRGLKRLSGDLGLLVEARVSDEQIIALEAEQQLQPAAAARRSRLTFGGGLRAAALVAFVSLLGGVVWWGALQFRTAPLRVLAQLEKTAGVAVSLVQPTDGVREVSSGAVHAGEELIITGEGEAVLSYPRGTTVRLAPGTRFSLREDMGSDAFHLLEGRARFEVTRSSRGYVVRTPVAVVSVLGTVFEVEHRPDVRRHLGDGETRVSVSSGEVWIARPQSGREPVTLKAGKRVLVNGLSMQFADLQTPSVAPARIPPGAKEPASSAKEPSAALPKTPRQQPDEPLDAPPAQKKPKESPKRP